MSHFSSPSVFADHCRFVKRIRRRYEGELGLLEAGPPTRLSLHHVIERLLTAGHSLAAALRITRQIVLERLAVLDIEQASSLSVVTTVMTLLAEVTLDRALTAACLEQDARYGVPLNAQGERILMWIVGMGKLGGRELNVSSDIDLVYVYEEEGQTSGRLALLDQPAPGGVVTASEYFSQVVKCISTLIGDTTEDGFVFRVDLALRPNGKSGPPAVSVAMLEEYFLVQGREWERFAWLKSRVVAPLDSLAKARALAIREVVRPFVFRRYLDYSVFASLRLLHQRIREEAQRRAAGRPHRANDVKLGRGGIREIEFIVQLLQVVRGGQYPEIRTRSTLLALERLSAKGFMSVETAQSLAQAYDFLRRVEHRIQYLDDQQTHLLPTDDVDLAWLAGAMGAVDHETNLFIDQLCQHREKVATEFDALLHDKSQPVCKPCGTVKPMLIDSEAFSQRFSGVLRQRLQALAEQPRVKLLRDEARLRLAQLIERAAAIASEAEPLSATSLASDGSSAGLTQAHGQLPHCGTIQHALSDTAQTVVTRFLDWLEPLLRRESYLALLAERPQVLRRLLRLLGLARWPMRYLMRYPGVIDELADDRLLQGRFQRANYLAELAVRYQALEREGQTSEEELLDTLRRAHHAEVFRILVRDVERQLEVEEVADELSALADATLDCALSWAWRHLKQRHRDQPRVAIIAYGKLGGKELGYGSDLDVVFVYDDPDERALEIYTALVRKLITWVTLRTAAGELFDIDTALRPNGNSGLLVTSIKSFAAYQAGRGGNTAWTWEHQAITRARWCAGEVDLAVPFESIRRQVLSAPRDPQALRAEVLGMRERLRQAHPVPARYFDLKHSPGGMIDVEFAVQWLVLAYGAKHAILLDDVGNIALLERAEAASLLPPGVGSAAADAYRVLRQWQHRARLDEAATRFDLTALDMNTGELVQHRQAVLALWQAVF